jgi:hypothetical protein
MSRMGRLHCPVRGDTAAGFANTFLKMRAGASAISS